VPWLGGQESLKDFVRQTRQRGWHVGTFCNGSRWVFSHKFSGYEGRQYFNENRGLESVCRSPNGQPVLETWDSGFRQSYRCCLGAAPTRRMAVDYVRTMVEWGFESLQFFDQNNGAATFPCFARDHEHPPTPGKWMTEKMEQTMAEFRQAAERAGGRGVIHSAESGVNEYCLPWFQETEFRMWPPGHGSGGEIPLYHFLFHECIVIQGMLGLGAEPYHLQIQNAANCVWGATAGGVLTGDGTLLNKDTPHFSPWEPKVGSDENGLEMMRAVTALRRGPGKDFLVLGRMLKPAAVTGAAVVSWTERGKTHCVPAVFDAAWQSPDGRFGVVLANWTTEQRTVSVADARLGAAAVVHVCGRQEKTSTAAARQDGLRVTLPPLSCAMLAALSNNSQKSTTACGSNGGWRVAAALAVGPSVQPQAFELTIAGAFGPDVQFVSKGHFLPN
jgi:hypothetical protein